MAYFLFKLLIFNVEKKGFFYVINNLFLIKLFVINKIILVSSKIYIITLKS